jgi:hypothetical protein
MKLREHIAGLARFLAPIPTMGAAAPGPGMDRDVRAEAVAALARTSVRRRIVGVSTAGRPHVAYVVSDADADQMLALLEVLKPDVRVFLHATGFRVRHGRTEIYFERGDSKRADGKEDQSDFDLARSELGLPPGNVSTVQLFVFQGVRSVSGVKLEDLPPAERARIERVLKRHPLLKYGHAGISLNDGTTIHGFTPDRSSRMDLTDSQFEALIRSNAAVPGIAGNDTPIFSLAAYYARTEGWDIDISNRTILLDVERRADIETQMKRNSENGGKGAGDGHGYSYQFPYKTPNDQGSHYADECTKNCATYPELLGLDVPENSGLLSRYVPKLLEWADPVDQRSGIR